jgi:hypothetical protein
MATSAGNRDLRHGAATALRYAHVAAAIVDTAYISRQVTCMEQAVATDPELAIVTAKEFLETVCKTILDGTAPSTTRVISPRVDEEHDQSAPAR